MLPRATTSAHRAPRRRRTRMALVHRHSIVHRSRPRRRARIARSHSSAHVSNALRSACLRIRSWAMRRMLGGGRDERELGGE
eukprot:2089161-Pleurochrysis_carterae.AAC.4